MDRIAKFLKKLSKKERTIFLKIFKDIQVLNVDKYDIKQLKGLKGVFRLRKGNIRVIFTKQKGKGIILKISFRKNAY